LLSVQRATPQPVSSTIGVEKVLNELPQFVPALSQFTTTDVQQTANNTIGGSYISLRGLGPNRNLVLIASDPDVWHLKGLAKIDAWYREDEPRGITLPLYDLE